MATQIPLTQGVFAVVDDSDVDLLKGHNWWCFTPPRRGLKYAATGIDGNMVGMHRLIMGTPDAHVDHIDGDGLNNQRSNLRLATHAQNQMNAKKRVGTSSRFKGVSWSKQNRTWIASIKVEKQTIHLGCFVSEDEAGRRYDMAATRYFGDFARTNESLGLFDQQMSA